MKTTGLIVLTYGIFVMIGGVIGFLIASSSMSLIAGLLFGALITMNALRLLKNNLKALPLSMLQAFILAVFFTHRLKVTHKFMPAGLMIILSALVGSFLLYKLISSKLGLKKVD